MLSCHLECRRYEQHANLSSPINRYFRDSSWRDPHLLRPADRRTFYAQCSRLIVKWKQWKAPPLEMFWLLYSSYLIKVPKKNSRYNMFWLLCIGFAVSSLVTAGRFTSVRVCSGGFIEKVRSLLSTHLGLKEEAKTIKVSIIGYFVLG